MRAGDQEGPDGSTGTSRNARKNRRGNDYWLYNARAIPRFPGPTAPLRFNATPAAHHPSPTAMKVLSSLNSAKRRHADCQVVKRKGTLYVICKSNPKFKARQGATPGTRMSKKGVK